MNLLHVGNSSFDVIMRFISAISSLKIRRQFRYKNDPTEFSLARHSFILLLFTISFFNFPSHQYIGLHTFDHILGRINIWRIIVDNISCSSYFIALHNDLFHGIKALTTVWVFRLVYNMQFE